MINAIKQEPQVSASPRAAPSLAGLLIFSSDVKALGLQAAQGWLQTEAFYWVDRRNTGLLQALRREFNGKMPTSEQAGVYSSVLPT